MLPLRLRNQSEFASPRAQLQYKPFRSTEFSPRVRDEDEGSRAGPGALFCDECSSIGSNSHKRAPSLYMTERNVNPTLEATVQCFYNIHTAHDLAAQLKTRGNAVSALQSASPRFHAAASGTTGPGAYSPERVRIASQFYGTFPQLLERASPAAAIRDKQRNRTHFADEFALGGGATLEPHRSSSDGGSLCIAPHQTTTKPRRPHATPHTFDSPTHSRHLQYQQLNDRDIGSTLQSTQLVAALTPRNAYRAENRQLALAKTSHEHVARHTQQQHEQSQE